MRLATGGTTAATVVALLFRNKMEISHRCRCCRRSGRCPSFCVQVSISSCFRSPVMQARCEGRSFLLFLAVGTYYSYLVVANIPGRKPRTKDTRQTQTDRSISGCACDDGVGKVLIKMRYKGVCLHFRVHHIVRHMHASLYLFVEAFVFHIP